MAVTKNGSTVAFYVDGVPDPAVVYNVVFQVDNPGGDEVLREGSNLDNSFGGEIDEISVYSRELAAIGDPNYL